MTVFQNRIRRAYLRQRTIIEMVAFIASFSALMILWGYILIVVIPEAVDREFISRHASVVYQPVLGGDTRE